jgi:hypothetical protein
MVSSPPPTPSFSEIPTLEDANEHIANEPGALGRWFKRLMVPDEEAGEVVR